MFLPFGGPPNVQPVTFSALIQAQCTAAVLRLDEVHPVVSGNKWYKLQGYLAKAKAQGKTTIITLGGTWSNHIVATAAACAANGLTSVGIIRGERPAQLSSALQDAIRYGMRLYFISREAYGKKVIPDAVYDYLHRSESLIIPEGGYGPEGADGSSSILTNETDSFNYIVCAVGTGTTLAGLIKSAKLHQKVLGISVLKGNSEAQPNINALLPPHLHDKYTLMHQFHFGGYARHTPALLQSMNDWYRQTGIPSDFVYTGKLFAAVQQLCTEGYFEKASRIIMIHTGGLQGNRSLPQGVLIF